MDMRNTWCIVFLINLAEENAPLVSDLKRLFKKKLMLYWGMDCGIVCPGST